MANLSRGLRHTEIPPDNQHPTRRVDQTSRGAKGRTAARSRYKYLRDARLHLPSSAFGVASE